MLLSTVVAALLALVSSYEALPVMTEAPQEMVRLSRVARRSWIGVSIQTLTPKLAKANGNNVEEGALVSEVERKSPADSAGLEEGDVIVQFGDRMIYDAEDLQKAVGKVKPGTKVDVKIDRKGSSKTLAVTMGKNPDRMSGAFAHSGVGSFIFGRSKMIGAELRPLNEQLAEYFQAPDGKGVLVESVEKESPADKAGMKAGDVIVSIGSERVEDMGDVWDILSDYDEGEKVDLEVIRRGSSKKLTLEMEEGGEGSWYHYRTEPHKRWFNEDMGEAFKFKMHELPRIHIEKYMPDLDKLKFNMERFRDDMRIKVKPMVPKLEIERKIREKIQYKI